MNKTELFFDFEFTGLHQGTTPISLGIIAKDGRSFYAEFTDYAVSQVDDWIQYHVIDNLLFNDPPEGEDYAYTATRHESNPIGQDLYKAYSVKLQGDSLTVKRELARWLEQFGEVEMWGDCLAYDWVLFNNIFGNAFKLPENVYYIPFDLSTLLKTVGVDPDINREEFAFDGVVPAEVIKHNAKWDAEIIMRCYNKALSIGAAQEKIV